MRAGGGFAGAVSPKGTKAIVRELKNVAVRRNEQPYTLVLDRVGKPRESLGEFAATCGATGGGTFNDSPPGVWLDDDRFLTQTTLGKVVVLNTAEKKQEKVVEIALTHKPGEKAWETHRGDGFTPLGLQQPRFSLLPDGRVLYEADVVYFIDVAKKTWEKAAWRSLGHGFEYSAVPDKIEDVDRYTKTVTVSLRHKGKVIGTSESVWWTTRGEAAGGDDRRVPRGDRARRSARERWSRRTRCGCGRPRPASGRRSTCGRTAWSGG